MEDYHHDPKERPREKFPLSYETTHEFVLMVSRDMNSKEYHWFQHVFWNELPDPEYLKEHFEIDNRTAAEFFFHSTNDPDIKLYLAMRWGL